MPEPATWVADTPRFWYRRTVSGGHGIRADGRGDAKKRPGVRSRPARERAVDA